MTILSIDAVTNAVVAVVSFIVGSVVDRYWIKHKNIREKIIKIDSDLIRPLKENVEIKLSRIWAEHIFNFSPSNNLIIDGEIEYSYFERFILERSDAFEKRENQLILSYKADKILIQKGNEIIDGLNEYKEKLANLKEILPKINQPPRRIEIDAITQLLPAIGRNIADLNGPRFNKDILMISISVALDEPHLFDVGHVVRMELQEKKLSELRTLYQQDTEYYALLEDFKIRVEAVYEALTSVKGHLDDLHREWRDKYDI